MTAPVLLLSDLHLPNTPSTLRTAFLSFLEGPARVAGAVYILGDLFEYWIGDAEGWRDYAAEALAMRALSDAGVPLYFMHGNRDFLIGAAFADVAGLRLLPDPQRVELAGQTTLLSHGDRFCTDDHGYQRWRSFSRNRLVQSFFRTLPEFLRRRIAGAARSRSEADKRNKPEAIMNVNDTAVRAAFAQHEVSRIIHGHTHRPALHRLEVEGRTVERLVLADWRPGRLEYLVADALGLRRESLPSSATRTG